MKPVHRRFRPASLFLGVAAAIGLPSAPTLAGGTKTWEVHEHDDFDKGETVGVAIERSGRITLGFHPARGELTGTAALTCISSARGALIGTADPPTIFRVLAGKRKPRGAAKNKKISAEAAHSGQPLLPELVTAKVAELEGVAVSAMAELPNGDLVAAALPGGKLVRIDKRGKLRPFAELKAGHVWALLVHKQRLLVATGPRGELWSLNLSGGDAKVVLDVSEKDLLSMVAIGDDVVVGTTPQARLYRVSDKPEGELLHDFSGDEIKALSLTQTGLVAAVNEFDDRNLSSLDALTKNLDRTSLVGQPPTGTLGSDATIRADGKLYHVDLGKGRDLRRATEAPWELWLAKDKQYFTGLLPADEPDTVLVSASDGAKIYRVRGLRDVATVADFEERQATALCLGSNHSIIAATSHGTAVYELGVTRAHQGTYVSEVLDAKYPARFGAALLRGRGDLRLRARTGPTDEPDTRWSAWRPITLSPDPAGLRGDLSVVGRRRFLQVEVNLSGDDNELRGFEVFYAPENLAPLITTLEVETPQLTSGESDPEVEISWKAEARDGDDLIYDVAVRPEGGDETSWIPLSPQDSLLSKRELKWDLSTVPDGTYEVKVVASDEPSNGSARALSDQLISGPVVVDRRRPRISRPRVAGLSVSATAVDTGGYIHDVSYSIDGGPMRAVSASDGIFDSASEAFELRLPPDLARGTHRLVLRARDSFGNTAQVATVIHR